MGGDLPAVAGGADRRLVGLGWAAGTLELRPRSPLFLRGLVHGVFELLPEWMHSVEADL